MDEAIYHNVYSWRTLLFNGLWKRRHQNNYIIPVNDVEEEDEEPEQGQHRIRIHYGAKKAGIHIIQNTMMVEVMSAGEKKKKI